jgi:hypothetical protein
MINLIKKNWGWGLLFLVALYGYNTYTENSKKAALVATAEKEKDEAIEKAALTLIQKNNANYQWIKELQNRDISTPLLTADLQKMWIQKNPIFFIGRIQDISIKNSEEYLLKVKYSGFDSFLIGATLELELICKKELVDDLLSKHKEVIQSFGLGDSILVIADISSVESSKIKVESSDGDRKALEEKNIKIGIGKCIALEATGVMLPDFKFLAVN